MNPIPKRTIVRDRKLEAEFVAHEEVTCCWLCPYSYSSFGREHHHIFFPERDSRFMAKLCVQHHARTYPMSAHGSHWREIQVILLRELLFRYPDKRAELKEFLQRHPRGADIMGALKI